MRIFATLSIGLILQHSFGRALHFSLQTRPTSFQAALCFLTLGKELSHGYFYAEQRLISINDTGQEFQWGGELLYLC